jgi:hypothetical protein
VKPSNLEAARLYLRAGHSVCPSAKARPLHFAEDDDDLRPTLQGFARSNGEAAVIVAERTPRTFRETETWALDTYERALMAAGWVSGLVDSRVLRREAAGARAELENPASGYRPDIVLVGQRIITVAVAPVYPPTHPRYAPQAMLVLTWLRDVDGVPLAAVREVMRREHGWVYDAKELVLPLPNPSGHV